MTAQRSYSDKPCREIVNRKLFKNELLRNWPQLVLFFAIFTVILVIPISFIMNDAPVITNPDSDKARSLIANLRVFLQTIPALSAVIGVFSGLTTVTHINSKVGVGFWHSLPTSRDGLLLTGISVRTIYYLVAMLSGTAVSCLIIMPSHCLGKIFPELMVILCYAIAYFFMYYAITLFAAMITGTNVTRFLMTLFILFAPAIIALLFLWIFNYNAFYTRSYYYQNFITAYLFPHMFADDSAVKSIIFIAAAAVFLALAFMLYKKRKSESAGTPVTYRVAEEIVRYSCMFGATTVFGLVFNALFGETSGMIVGFAIGALLSFAVCNTVFKKSARAMFSNLKSLIIFAVVFSLVFVTFGLDVFGMDRSILPASMTKRMELSDGGLNYELTEKEDIEFAKAELERLIDIYDNGSVDEKITDEFYSDHNIAYRQVTTITVYIYPYVGIPIVKTIYCEEADAVEFFQKLNQRISTEKLITGTLKKCEDCKRISLSLGGEYDSFYSGDSQMHELFSFLASHADYYTEENTKDTIVGVITLRTVNSNENISRTVPVYSRDSELTEKLDRLFNSMDISQSLTNASSTIAEVSVLNKSNGKTATFTEKADINIILPATSYCSDYFGVCTSLLSLSAPNTDYAVILTTSAGDSFISYLRKDEVPSIVTDALK